MVTSTTQLSNGERLAVVRRRARRSQRSEAQARGVSLYQLRAWENDEETGPRVPVGVLHEHERYYLMRRRRGMQAGELADELGVSRWWLCQMERGSAPLERLRNYWQ